MNLCVCVMLILTWLVVKVTKPTFDFSSLTEMYIPVHGSLSCRVLLPAWCQATHCTVLPSQPVSSHTLPGGHHTIRVQNTDHGPGPSLARWNKNLLRARYNVYHHRCQVLGFCYFVLTSLLSFYLEKLIYVV